MGKPYVVSQHGHFKFQFLNDRRNKTSFICEKRFQHNSDQTEEFQTGQGQSGTVKKQTIDKIE